jgi:hypothetical protein
MEHFRRAVQADPGSAVVRRQLAQTVDRRLAVVGLAAGLLAGATVDLLRYAGEPAGWTLAAAPALVGMAAAAGWWRVRRLDDVLRACYRLERLRRWRMRGAV